MLVVKNISKKFGDKYAVKNLSFTVNSGEILALLGENGAGKTTTFRMILGVLKPDEGSVLYDGKIIDLSTSPIIGFLPEERSLIQKITIKQQLLYFAELKGMREKEIEKEIDRWLEYFGLTEFKNSKMKELSKGNQQKIQLVAAIIHNPKLLILDEPFSGLDPINIALFKQVILDLKANGCAIIFSSHRLDYVESFCEDIIVLINGVDEINGKINDIRRESSQYTIRIIADIDEEAVQAIDGVIEFEKTSNYYLVTVNDYSVVKTVYQEIRKSDFLEQFTVELPTLEQIIVKKVGEKNA